MVLELCQYWRYFNLNFHLSSCPQAHLVYLSNESPLSCSFSVSSVLFSDSTDAVWTYDGCLCSATLRQMGEGLRIKRIALWNGVILNAWVLLFNDQIAKLKQSGDTISNLCIRRNTCKMKQQLIKGLILLDIYTIDVRRRNISKEGGGRVTLCFRECFNCFEFYDGDDTIECIWVKIRWKAKKADMMVGVCYWTPIKDEATDESFYKELGENTPSLALIHMGDFNFLAICWE